MAETRQTDQGILPTTSPSFIPSLVPPSSVFLTNTPRYCGSAKKNEEQRNGLLLQMQVLYGVDLLFECVSFAVSLVEADGRP